MSSQPFKLSVVVPVFNEAEGLPVFHFSLLEALRAIPNATYEIVYSDDGSSDGTMDLVRRFRSKDPTIKLVRLSRNFGKESALAAGLAEATGDATIMLDGDGQHPVTCIKEFVEAWRQGAQVVIGIRERSEHDGWLKRWGSKLFYRLFNMLSDQQLVPYSTDFRLVDRQVLKVFLELKETDRLSRSLFDWLGFERRYVTFRAKSRTSGVAGYTLRKLTQLAVRGLVSFSTAPLYIFGGLGVIITAGALLLGMSVLIEQVLLHDPWQWRFSGTAMLGILLLFLVGIVLMSQGILAVYLSHVHALSKQRPLYVVDYEKSAGLHETDL